ncbi:CpaD family pilus assembly protein [Prosthecomicrobium sp. N25]|uniref:CpaD family pilus assembly protein n=1 Tax=Prosthecomicrobium sp. N25 TaxID=3129254 RepID=UPI0030781580
MRHLSPLERRASGTGPRRLAARLALLAAAAAALPLAGCATKVEPSVTASIPHDGYRSRHPILVTEQAETLDVPVGSQSGKLSETMLSTVEIFGATAVERGASGVTVMVPSGSGNESAAFAASRQVAAALKRGGVPAHAISHQPYSVEASAADAPIRLAYPRVVAGVPHACGTWPDQIIGQHDNSDYYNFGCAYQSNIAAMAANPSDLVTPQGMTPPDATRRTTVFRKYREGTPTKSEQNLQKQTIANIGS